MSSPKKQKEETFTSTGDSRAEQKREAGGVTRATDSSLRREAASGEGRSSTIGNGR